MTLLRGGRKEGLCPSAFGLTPGYLQQEEPGEAVRHGPQVSRYEARRSGPEGRVAIEE